MAIEDVLQGASIPGTGSNSGTQDESVITNPVALWRLHFEQQEGQLTELTRIRLLLEKIWGQELPYELDESEESDELS